MPEPLIFISHKHSDRAIANVVRSFITEQSTGRIRVFQSSDPSAPGPRIARHLNTELRKALWEASAVILIYTNAENDWGYCMWECGVATHPESPDTSVIVFQCSSSAPELFAGQVHVDARQSTSVEKFVRQLMTDREFLPGHAPITGYERNDPKVAAAATRLFSDLKAVLPEGSVEEWPAHPYVQLQLAASAAKLIVDAVPEERRSIAERTIRSKATVSECDREATSLFGMAKFKDTLTLDELFGVWRASHSEVSEAWLESLTDQIARAAQWQFPILKWAAMPGSDNRLHAPVLTRVRSIPSSGVMQFDVYFYPFNMLESTSVTSRMVPRREMFCRVLEEGEESGVMILDLLRELDEKLINRVPFVSRDDKLVYIAHRSMLDRFIARQITKGLAGETKDLTLADLLNQQPEMRTTFKSSAAFVERTATLGDAKAAMHKNRGCRDVFVTAVGKPDEPILGYVTDVLLATSEIE
jgi:hypothetical protein